MYYSCGIGKMPIMHANNLPAVTFLSDGKDCCFYSLIQALVSAFFTLSLIFVHLFSILQTLQFDIDSSFITLAVGGRAAVNCNSCKNAGL